MWESYISGADPGFPVGGGPNPPGAPTYNFAKFSIKLHEIKNIFAMEGAHPVDPPLIRCAGCQNIMIATHVRNHTDGCDFYKSRKS